MQWRDKSGAVSILAAGSAATLVAAAALAVDLGSVFLNARRLQGAADLAAMAAAQDVGNAKTRAAASVAASLPAQNVKIVTQTGAYIPNPSLAPAQRFTPIAAAPNAASVELEVEAPLFFASIFTDRGAVKVTRRATAATAQLASFQVGTRLAALSGGAPNAVLSALTGSTVSLSVMDYNALAGAKVDLFSFMKSVRTEANLQAATFDEVLTAQVKTGDALDAIIGNITGPDLSRATDAIETLARAAKNAPPVALGKVIDLGVYGTQDEIAAGSAKNISVSALDLSNAVLEAANGGRQVKLTANAAVPGLTKLDIWLAIGERPNKSPWLTIAADQTPVIRTAQMRLYADARVGVAGLAGIASARLPILVEAASAQARLDAIACSGLAPSQVRLSAAPSIGEIAIADIDIAKLNDFKTPLTQKDAAIANAALIKVSGLAHAKLGGDKWQDVSFNSADIAAMTVKSVSTADLAAATTASLVGDLNLNVSALGFGVNANAISAAVKPPLTAAAPALDTLINELTGFLGVRLGEADLRVNGVRCRGAALVQ